MGLFGRWLSPACPIDLPSRVWLVKHLLWLKDEFGRERLIESPIIEPSDRFFPGKYDCSPRAMLQIFHQVCDYMDVPTESVELQFFRNDAVPYLVTADGLDAGVAVGTYQGGELKHVIRLDEDKSEDPMTVVSTLSHELAHLRLMGEARIDPMRWDNELLTDLCSIFFGFGIFRLNRPAYSVPTDAVWPGTGIRRPEYMTVAMSAYALATITSLRFEERPAWARYLKGAAKSEFRASMKWVEKESKSN
ncbi:MAG: hypothetical protein H7144_07160 [Burkholderiales bacterium]|nr:hypothetical protein [Phycisphaerae bacterium]